MQHPKELTPSLNLKKVLLRGVRGFSMRKAKEDAYEQVLS
jgi:hypothetical protein